MNATIKKLKAKLRNRISAWLLILPLTLQPFASVLADDKESDSAVKAAEAAKAAEVKAAEAAKTKENETSSESKNVEVPSSRSTGTESSVQASVRPQGLQIAAKVMTAGSDKDAASFQKTVLPSVTKLLNTRLGEGKEVNDAAMLLDPSKLKLQTDSDVRVYFIGEGAGYHNTLGYNTSGGGTETGDPKLIFPDASSAVSTDDPSSTVKRTTSAPLLPGDFVNLGKLSSGQLLNFFLIADGANGGKNVYSTDKSVNPDAINHVVTFAYAVPGTSMLVIGFEDLYGGGDRDFNDLLFAVDIGAANVAALTGTPEPALGVTMGSLILGTVLYKRRRDRKMQASQTNR